MRALAVLFALVLLLLLFWGGPDDAEHAEWKSKVDRIRADVVAGRK